MKQKCPKCECTKIWDEDCPSCDGSGMEMDSDDACEECEGSGYHDGYCECSECGFIDTFEEFEVEDET